MKISIKRSTERLTKIQNWTFKINTLESIYVFALSGKRPLVFKVYYKPFGEAKKDLRLAPALARGWAKRRIKELKLWINEAVLLQPIYYYAWGRDCDMFESSLYGIVKGRKAFRELVRDFYDNAEGDSHINRVSQAEYMDNHDQQTFRDRVAEAYDNGNGNSILV